MTEWNSLYNKAIISDKLFLTIISPKVSVGARVPSWESKNGGQVLLTSYKVQGLTISFLILSYCNWDWRSRTNIRFWNRSFQSSLRQKQRTERRMRKCEHGMDMHNGSIWWHFVLIHNNIEIKSSLLRIKPFC